MMKSWSLQYIKFGGFFFKQVIRFNDIQDFDRGLFYKVCYTYISVLLFPPDAIPQRLLYKIYDIELNTVQAQLGTKAARVECEQDTVELWSGAGKTQKQKWLAELYHTRSTGKVTAGMYWCLESLE